MELWVHKSLSIHVGANLGPTHTHECARLYSERRHGCSADAKGGQTGQGDRSDRFAGEERRSPTNARPGRTPSGQAHVGLF